MAKKKFTYPFTEELEIYLDAVETVEGIEVKGKANPYTSFNGYMQSFLDKEAYFNLRVSAELKAEAKSEHAAEDVVAYGKNMPDFVKFPKSIWKDKALMLNWLEKGLAHCKTLKPK